MSECEPPSPCIRVCVLDPQTDICTGCYRTLDEIAGWSGFSADEKWAILRELDTRKRADARRHED